MQITMYNTNKHRLETVDVEITNENTTWFDYRTGTDITYKMTDFKGGLLIEKADYSYPMWIDAVTREDIGHDYQKVEELLTPYE
jgi:hypothetical protein